ncbi:MinD/ParA family protein [Sphingosinicella terrae]|uniref:MinD/ParA family protein n=1 Tax=Sphingosinicella terrae TaxID=2172047 RepID=UPI000E0D508C|nr:MinD/ParA family protein [Sphingosinicella terrae]
MNSRPVRNARVIAVASGKGGVGKSNVSVNLAVALAGVGRQAMLVDCDMGLANANILLGINGNWTLGDVLGRHCALEDILQRGPGGILLAPGHSGTGIGSTLGERDRQWLAGAFRPYADSLDYVVVDTGSGISLETLGIVAASDRILLVLSGEPTAFMDAYALVKALTVKHGCAEVSVVANMVTDDESGRALYERFAAVIGKFLAVELDYLGAIPEDRHLRDAVLRKRCCVEAYPSARASRAFRRLAERIVQTELAPIAGGHRFFGMEALHGAH